MLSNKKLLAVADGEALPISAVPDPVFSGGMLGEGFAVEPRSGTIYSPISGTVENIADTLHAYSIHSPDGLDVLVHIGVDTVKLGGRGFVCLVEQGDSVRAGDIIAKADVALIRSEGLSAITPVLVANSDALGDYKITFGNVRGGKSAVLTYKNKNK